MVLNKKGKYDNMIRLGRDGTNDILIFVYPTKQLSTNWRKLKYD